MKRLVSAKIWLILPILIYFLSACERSKDIGFKLVPQGNVEVHFTDTLTVDASTILAKEVITSNSGVIMVGQYIDPVLGRVTATSYFEIAPPLSSGSAKIALDQADKTEIAYDSLVLNLGVAGVYGNLQTTQTIRIYELTDSIKNTANTTYYNNSSVRYANTPMATITFKASDIDRSRALRIKLNDYPGFDDFRQRLTGLAADSATRDVFLDAIKGWAIVPEPSENGSVVTFAAGSINTTLTLFYTKTTATEKKSLTYLFYPGFGDYFHQIAGDKSSTLLSGLNTPLQAINSRQTNNLSFIQAGLGVQTKLRFPSLKNLRDLGNVAINKAELIIKPLVSSTEVFTAPFGLYMYEAKPDNDIHSSEITVRNGVIQQVPTFVLPEGAGSAQEAFVSYDSRNQEYRIQLTTQMQRLLLNQLERPDIIIAPYSLYSFASVVPTPAAASASVTRLVLNNDKSSQFRMRLRVFYTLFK
ncbi:MAG: DUF4270 domain-containing protein [Microscillaceae bacterium]|jgi:hypothetical protein|nr:DUF4270 domain-containing protein [Microscillaceae bacterium]